MSIAVVSEISPPMLTTVGAVKRRLRLAGSTDDVLIGDLIVEASAEVVRYCGRSFARARVRESGLREEFGDVAVSLTPLVEVHSVWRGGGPILDFRIEDADAGMITASSGILAAGEARWWSDSFVHGGADSFEVEYTGGFLTPEEPAEGQSNPPPRTLPHDIEGAVIRMVSLALPPAPGTEPALKSIKVEDITYQYAETRPELGEAALSITDRLDRWRRVA